MLPKDVTDSDMIFGRIEGLLPAMADLPDAYRKGRGKPSVQLTERWFFRGLKDVTFQPRPGITVEKALRHIKCCLTSWEPAHEHKTAGVAFLLDQFFEQVVVEGEVYTMHIE